MRRENGTRKTGKLKLIAGGNMIGSKGLSMAVRALKIVKDTGVDFHYTVAGDGPEIESIRKLIQELGLGREVELHPGFQGSEYIATLQDSDMFFLPSLRETAGITLIEAVIAGCFPIVADASAAGEIVRRVGGIAVPVQNPDQVIDALAAAILKKILHDEPIEIRENRIMKLVSMPSEDSYMRTVEISYAVAMESV